MPNPNGPLGQVDRGHLPLCGLICGYMAIYGIAYRVYHNIYSATEDKFQGLLR